MTRINDHPNQNSYLVYIGRGHMGKLKTQRQRAKVMAQIKDKQTQLHKAHLKVAGVASESDLVKLRARQSEIDKLNNKLKK